MIKGERKVELQANKVGVQTIDMQFKNKDPFFNINTNEDLEEAKLIMQTYDQLQTSFTNSKKIIYFNKR